MEFYFVDKNYVDFLQKVETKKRGFTKVPYISYESRDKFIFGVVLKVNQFNYYVSLSSFKVKQDANILIEVETDAKKIKGSLRFNYMFPVPEKCLTKIVIRDIKDRKYRNLLNKEFKFCIDNIEKIQQKAEQIYKLVTQNKRRVLVQNSCDFKTLESAYLEYITKT